MPESRPNPNAWLGIALATLATLAAACAGAPVVPPTVTGEGLMVDTGRDRERERRDAERAGPADAARELRWEPVVSVESVAVSARPSGRFAAERRWETAPVREYLDRVRAGYPFREIETIRVGDRRYQPDALSLPLVAQVEVRPDDEAARRRVVNPDPLGVARIGVRCAHPGTAVARIRWSTRSPDLRPIAFAAPLTVGAIEPDPADIRVLDVDVVPGADGDMDLGVELPATPTAGRRQRVGWKVWLLAERPDGRTPLLSRPVTLYLHFDRDH